MQKVKRWSVVLLVIGMVAAGTLMGWTISQESKRPKPESYEFVGFTGKKFVHEGIVYKQIKLKRKSDGAILLGDCPCIVGSICFPACAED